MTTVYLLYLDGRYHKTYQSVGNLRAAIRCHAGRTLDRMGVRVVEVTGEPVDRTLEEIMGERCPECWGWESKTASHRGHKYNCSRRSLA